MYHGLYLTVIEIFFFLDMNRLNKMTKVVLQVLQISEILFWAHIPIYDA